MHKLSQLNVLFSLFALLLYTAAASGQVSVSAQLSTRTQYVNDPIELRIIVDGTTQGIVPETPEIDGVELEFITSAPRSSRSISFINGQRTEQVSESVSFIFRVMARTPGRYIVPAITVRSGANELTTRPLAFEAIAPERPDEFVLTAELDRDDVFVGEPVQVRMVWYVGLEVDSASFERNRPIDGLRIIPRQDPTYNVGRRSENLQAFGIFGNATTAELGRGELEGRRYTTVTIDATLVPERAGSFTFGPLGVDFSFARPGERQLFRGESVTQPLRLTVRPLPEQDKPTDFQRLVGDHTITTHLDRDTVSVGDPITLRLDIRSTNQYSLISNAPTLENIPDFSSSFRADSEGWQALPSAGPGVWSFTRTIRVNNAAVQSLPSIPLWWFDPQSNRYRQATSEPIPLTVRPTLIVTAADAVGSAPGTLGHSSATERQLLAPPPSSTQARTLGSAAPGLWALDRDPLRSATSTLGSMSIAQRRGLLAVLLIPPALVVLIWVISGYRRAQDPGRIYIKRARRRAIAAIRSATRVDDLGETLSRFAIVVRGGPEAAACAADVFVLLKETGIAPPPELHELCAQPEHRSFGIADSAYPPTPDQRRIATSIVRQIASHLLNEHSHKPRSTPMESLA